MNIDELRHALVIQPGDKELDFEALIDLGTLHSATAGLATTFLEPREDSPSLRLVHYTLHEYFQQNQKRIFPNLQLNMARVCLTYLSLYRFGSEVLSVDNAKRGQYDLYDLTSQRLDDFCFLHYASFHWTHHLRTVQTELISQSLAFVLDHVKTAAWLQCFEHNEILDKGLDTNIDLP